ncbi:drug/metabolite transporter (DMT)-like permease [Kitasatospora sp. MAA19]|nr:drug/metabolite transporter (DMT)-like permease [Kitasatospora sp. MAA19]
MGGVAQILDLAYLNPIWWLSVAILGFKLFALLDAVTRREDAYRAADKKTKPFWLTILAIAFGWDLLFGVNFFTGIGTLAGLVASIVYMVDVRPAIRALTGGGGRGGRSNAGPYGPW